MGKKSKIPIIMLHAFDVIPILVLIPLMDRVIIPYLRNKLGFQVTMLQRVGVGFIFATLAMVFAMIVEIVRKQSTVSTTVISECNDSVYISEISIFWQIPQFVSFGISEVLAAINGINFFVSQSPKHMKSVILALYYFTHSFSSWMVSLLIFIVTSATLAFCLSSSGTITPEVFTNT